MPSIRPRRVVARTTLAFVIGVPAVALAANITGTSASDNDSYTFPYWRSALHGTSSADSIHGLTGDDILYGYNGNDALNGDAGNDRLYGHGGNDGLIGGVDGADLMWGGPGDDRYQVYDFSDRVYERPGEGRDEVATTLSFLLPANVEDLQLYPNLIQTAVVTSDGAGGSVAFAGNCAGITVPCRSLATWAAGNALDNVIGGNGLDNYLYGLAGQDVLHGGNGADQLRGGDGHDVLIGGRHNDILRGESGNDVLAAFIADGNAFGYESEELHGGPGADKFVIGISNRPGGIAEYDQYFVNLVVANEQFPQYLGQSEVRIMDFQWQQGDTIEVFGDIGRYWVTLSNGPNYGPMAVIHWDGSHLGFRSDEPVGFVMGITNLSDVIPSLDFR